MHFREIFTWVAEVVTSTAGHLIGTGVEGLFDKKDGKTTAQAVGTAIGQAAKRMAEERRKTRQGFLHELRIVNRRTHDGCAAILDLFKEFNRGRNVIWVDFGTHRKPYREGWTENKLRSIPPEERDAEWPILDRELQTGRPEFFTSLEILNDDEWRQRMTELRMRLGESRAAQVIGQAATALDAAATDATPGAMQVVQNINALRDWLRNQALS